MGRSHGRHAFGWTRTVLPDGSKVETINAEQAALVRSASERIVRGDTLRSIVMDLNGRGILSPTGKPWGKTMLRHLVTRERNVALRVHHDEVVGKGDWPPIVDRALWEQVRAVLADPDRRTSTSSASVHLLSGLARCGVCGGAMRAALNRKVPSYRCHDRSCVSRNRADMDAFVTAVVIERLSRPDAAGLSAPTDDRAREAVREVGELRARLDNAADDYADGALDREQFHRITERLRPRLDAAQARARVVDSSPLLDGLAGADEVRAVWDGLPLSRRRGVLDLLLSVRVMRTKPGARTFDPACVRIEWRRA